MDFKKLLVESVVDSIKSEHEKNGLPAPKLDVKDLLDPKGLEKELSQLGADYAYAAERMLDDDRLPIILMEWAADARGHADDLGAAKRLAKRLMNLIENGVEQYERECG